LSLLNSQAEPYVDAKQAAQYLAMSRKKLLSLARSGYVPAHGIGGTRKMWRFRLSELDHWMQSELRAGKKETLVSAYRGNMPTGSPR
jgi:excisionase family DNA binding protein